VSSPDFSFGKATASSEANATATFTFTGKSIAWMGTKCQTCGAASVTVDTAPPIVVNTNDSSTDLESEAVWWADLSPGSHTVVITNTSGAQIFVDGFWVNPL
jgi:hypothetical protein